MATFVKGYSKLGDFELDKTASEPSVVIVQEGGAE